LQNVGNQWNKDAKIIVSLVTPRDTRRLVLKAIFIQKKGVSPNFWNTNLYLVSSIFHALRRVLLAAIGNVVWFIFRVPDRGIRAARFCLGLNVQDQLCMKSWQSWRREARIT
jgi:hypothetical protein